jgi:hypothetical protein
MMKKVYIIQKINQEIQFEFFQARREREKKKKVWNGSSEKDRKMLSIPKVPSWSFPKNMPEKFKLNENGNKYLILTIENLKFSCSRCIFFEWKKIAHTYFILLNY